MSTRSSTGSVSATYRHNPYGRANARVTGSDSHTQASSVATSRRVSAQQLNESYSAASASESFNPTLESEESHSRSQNHGSSSSTINSPAFASATDSRHLPHPTPNYNTAFPHFPGHQQQILPQPNYSAHYPHGGGVMQHQITYHPSAQQQPLQYPVAPMPYPLTSGTVCVGVAVPNPLRFLPPPPPSRTLLLDGVLQFETFCNMLLRWYNKVIATEKFYWLRVNALAPRAEEYSCNIHEWATLVSEWWWTYVSNPRMVSFEDLHGTSHHAPMPLRRSVHPANTKSTLNASVEVGKLTGK